MLSDPDRRQGVHRFSGQEKPLFGALLIGVSGIVAVEVDFEAKPIQLRAVLLLNALQGLYTKVYYDLPMKLEVDVDLLSGLTEFNVYEKNWDYSWTLLDKHIVEWLEPDF